MLAHVFFALAAQEERTVDPKALLRTTMQQVQRAKSFEATVEHHNSNSTFPGDFTQRLRWQSGVGFDLVLTDRGTGATSIPNFYSRGGMVTSIYRDMRRTTETSANRPFITPAWEALGGINFSFLLRSSYADVLFAEPKTLPPANTLPPPDQDQPPTHFVYSIGERKNWQGESVREIVAKKGESETVVMSIFIHPTSRYVIGMESKSADGEPGWVVFRNIKMNPEMPSDLGYVPGG